MQRKVTAMENGLATFVSTGMAAIGTAIVALLKAGDHIVTSQYLFGNTASLFQTLSDTVSRSALLTQQK